MRSWEAFAVGLGPAGCRLVLSRHHGGRAQQLHSWGSRGQAQAQLHGVAHLFVCVVWGPMTGVTLGRVLGALCQDGTGMVSPSASRVQLLVVRG